MRISCSELNLGTPVAGRSNGIHKQSGAGAFCHHTKKTPKPNPAAQAPFMIPESWTLGFNLRETCWCHMILTPSHLCFNGVFAEVFFPPEQKVELPSFQQKAPALALRSTSQVVFPNPKKRGSTLKKGQLDPQNTLKHGILQPTHLVGEIPFFCG